MYSIIQDLDTILIWRGKCGDNPFPGNKRTGFFLLTCCSAFVKLLWPQSSGFTVCLAKSCSLYGCVWSDTSSLISYGKQKKSCESVPGTHKAYSFASGCKNQFFSQSLLVAVVVFCVRSVWGSLYSTEFILMTSEHLLCHQIIIMMDSVRFKA